jgi:hypothetical protein
LLVAGANSGDAMPSYQIAYVPPAVSHTPA